MEEPKLAELAAERGMAPDSSLSDILAFDRAAYHAIRAREAGLPGATEDELADWEDLLERNRFAEQEWYRLWLHRRTLSEKVS